jgi:hypothetical protein
MPLTPLKLPDLVNLMNGQPTTNGWDVLCSYSMSHINTLLKSKYDAGKLVNEVKFSTDRQDPLTQTELNIAYDVLFGAPSLSFIAGSSGNATLTMPISGGSYTITEKGSATGRTSAIPANTYSIQGVFPLAAVNGTTGQVSQKGDVIVFDDGKTEESHVIIHFRNEKGANFKILPKPDPSRIDILETFFLPVLNQHFIDDVQEIDYSMAYVNNAPAQNGDRIFSPNAFVFATMGGDPDGVLSIYIQTKESGNPMGDPDPAFQPSNKEALPVPDGYTASLILSYGLITNGFISKQLSVEGFTSDFIPAAKGIMANVSKKASITAVDASGNSIFENHNYPGVSIPLTTYPLRLVIDSGAISVGFNGDCNDINWDSNTFGGGHWGKVDVNISMAKAPKPIAVTNNDINVPALDLTSGDFRINTSSHSCSIWETMAECSTVYPNYYNNLPISIPNLDVRIYGLNFFLETNVLAPGTKVVNIDDKAGVNTPHDFIIVGQLIG